MNRIIERGSIICIAAFSGLFSMAGPGSNCRTLEILFCEADAGSLTATASAVCYTGGPVNISAVWNDPVVPTDYQGLFFLTRGPTQVIVQGAFTPAFNVTAIDEYTIHALVYNPTTLNLGVLTFGQSTLGDVHAQLEQGGGTLCAGLDMIGASVMVQDCTNLCDAHAGTMSTAAPVVCTRTGLVWVDAIPNGNAAVPLGFTTVYLLSAASGAVIRSVGTAPQFDVESFGTYAIHRLVFDPATLDLSSVVPGSTTISGLNTQLTQGGGSICAGLDVAGATVSVESCRPQNDDCANALHMVISAVGDCNTSMILGDNTYATEEVGDRPVCDPDAGGLADIWYTFNSGANTEVSLVLGPISMSNWALTVVPICGGSELVCEIDPAVPIDVSTLPNTDYRVRIYTDLGQGNGGAFAFCITGAHPNMTCVGGAVGLADGSTVANICKDGSADILEFATTSHSAENYAYVLADHTDALVSLIPGHSMDFDPLPIGSYRVWGVSYKGDLDNAHSGVLVSELTSTGDCLERSNDFLPVDVGVCTGFASNGVELWNVSSDLRSGSLNVLYNGPTTIVYMDVLGVDGRLMAQQSQIMAQGQIYAMDLGGHLGQGVYTVRLWAQDQIHVVRMFAHP